MYFSVLPNRPFSFPQENEMAMECIPCKFVKDLFNELKLRRAKKGRE